MTNEPIVPNDVKHQDLGSTAEIASLPWTFTQSAPLDSDDFLREANRRNLDLDISMLRELYRHGILVPFVAVRSRQVGQPSPATSFEPQRAGTRLSQLRAARDAGRLLDLRSIPFRPRLAFARRSQQRVHWWNGLLYSSRQLIILFGLDSYIASASHHVRGHQQFARLQPPGEFLVRQAGQLQRAATMATALEARYLPTVGGDWIRLRNADMAEWKRYRGEYDAGRFSQILGYPGKQALDDAEHLLHLAGTCDPLDRPWNLLIRRAKPEAWDRLSGSVLLALDLRLAAEILLNYYEDLAAIGQVPSLSAVPTMASHPLQERLSYRPNTLDENLAQLGISPHPRVVLAVEGETEEVHVPLVFELLDYAEVSELVRVLKLGGVDRDLTKVAALAAAPLVGQKYDEGYWSLIKPPTCLLVAIDPEGRYATPDKVEAQRQLIVNEIKGVLKAQGAVTSDHELEQLVQIRPWSDACYELAHFTDEELASAIGAVHSTHGGLTIEELAQSIAETRRRRKDIKEVWNRWEYKVSKVDLAHALWPILRTKIEQALADEKLPMPEIADVVAVGYRIAQRWRYPTFVIDAL